MKIPKIRNSAATHAEPGWRTSRLATIQSVVIGVVVAALIVVFLELHNRPTRAEVDKANAKANGAVAAATSANGALSSAGLPTVSVPTSAAAPTATVTVTGANGAAGLAGRGIVAAEIQGSSLILTYNDGVMQNVGSVVGPVGSSGSNGSNGSNGAAGRGVQSVSIDGNGHMIVTYSDGSVVDVGQVVGATGPAGVNGTSGTDGANGANGQGVGGFTFTVPGVLGDTVYTCTPDDASQSAHYTCVTS